MLPKVLFIYTYPTQQNTLDETDVTDAMREENPIDVVLDELQAIKEKMDGLEGQVGINCKKLDDIKKDTGILPQILEIVTANGQGIEMLASRVNDLEDARS